MRQQIARFTILPQIHAHKHENDILTFVCVSLYEITFYTNVYLSKQI